MTERGGILLLALVFETTLALTGLLWCYFSATPILTRSSALSLSSALLLAIALLLLQRPLRRLIRRYPLRFRASQEFLDEVVLPFCRRLRPRDALLVSIAAGVGEELLFRAAMLPAWGLLLSSLLFAVLHFGPLALRYPFFLGCYFLISVVFSLQYLLSEDIFSCILTHALYDFLAIRELRAAACREGIESI